MRRAELQWIVLLLIAAAAGAQTVRSVGKQTYVDPYKAASEFDPVILPEHGKVEYQIDQRRGKPMLVYDEQRDQIYMLGVDQNAKTLMYAYNAVQGSWSQLNPARLPACANEGSLVYEASKGSPLYVGGVCANSSADNETLEWDGSTWNKADLKANLLRLFAAGAAYDSSRDLTVIFGGSSVVKDCPQPQVPEAFGFLTMKPEPSMPSFQSMEAPRR